MNEQNCIMQTSMMRMALLTESETYVLVLFWIISSCLPPSLTLSQTLSFSLPLSPSLCPLSVHPLRASLSLFHSLRSSGSSLAIPSSLALSPVTCSSLPREKHCHSFGPHSLASYSLPVSLCFDGPARRVLIVREIPTGGTPLPPPSPQAAPQPRAAAADARGRGRSPGGRRWAGRCSSLSLSPCLPPVSLRLRRASGAACAPALRACCHCARSRLASSRRTPSARVS